VSEGELFLNTDKKIIDVCCGPKGFWFNKKDSRVLFMDKRKETHENNYPSGYKKTIINPDVIGDFTNILYPDATFCLVVFDPPHIIRDSPPGEIRKRYGDLRGDWRNMLRKGFSECFRVLKPNGVLIFKWNSTEIPLKEILRLTNEKPLFGHVTRRNLKTHWVTFMKNA